MFGVAVPPAGAFQLLMLVFAASLGQATGPSLKGADWSPFLASRLRRHSQARCCLSTWCGRLLCGFCGGWMMARAGASPATTVRDSRLVKRGRGK